MWASLKYVKIYIAETNRELVAREKKALVTNVFPISQCRAYPFHLIAIYYLTQYNDRKTLHRETDRQTDIQCILLSAFIAF